MSAIGVTRLALRENRKRIALLIAFAGLFVISGFVTRILAGGPEGHIEFDRLLMMGGYPVISAVLLLGWLLGRYPMIAALVLTSGIISRDREQRYLRIYSVRPGSRIALYAQRFIVMAAAAFVLSVLLLPVFDVLMLGKWAGPGTLLLIYSYVIVYASLTTLLSVWLRADAWIALALGLAAMIWNAMGRADILQHAPPVIRELVTFILPPQGALFAIEQAYGAEQPIPMAPVLYVTAYAIVALSAAAVFLRDVEI